MVKPVRLIVCCFAVLLLLGCTVRHLPPEAEPREIIIRNNSGIDVDEVVLSEAMRGVGLLD